MQNEQITELTAFNSAGVLMGRAKWDWRNGWIVTMAWTGGASTTGAVDRGECEKILRNNGAVIIQESDGRK